MSFPQHENKHGFEALFTAKDFQSYKKSNLRLPESLIVTFENKMERYVKKKYSPKHLFKIDKLQCVWNVEGLGFIRLTGIGAPHAVTVLEELIALGVKNIIVVGSAGGLHQEGIVLCDKAVRDEGTSFHYLPHGKYAFPDKSLTKELESALKKHNKTYLKGATWTIDAPYRETKKEIEHYKKEGVLTVEMEASAIFSLGQVRNVKTAAVFFISDVLGKKWDPQFHSKTYKQELPKLIDVAITAFRARH